MNKLVLLLFTAFSIGAGATGLTKDVDPSQEGLFEVAAGRYLYAKVYRGYSTKPAIVFVNGLTQDTDHWKSNLPELLKTGRTLVFYDTQYQGRSLEDYVERNQLWSQIYMRPTLPPLLWFKSFYMGRKALMPAIDVEQHSRDLRNLLDQLDIKKTSVVGLSFGGAIAIQYSADYPETVEQTFAAAPYIEPQAEQDHLIKFTMEAYKRTFPLIRFDDDELYDLIFRGIVLSTYYMAEPTILKWGPFQTFGVAELARGVRHMDAAILAKKLPPRTLNLIIAGMDSYIQREVHMRFWKSVPKASRSSLAVIEGVEHKMNESVGPFLAAWIAAVLTGKSSVQEGRIWQGHPEKGLMHTEDGKSKVELPVTSPCENYLRPNSPNSPNLAIDRIARDQSEIFRGWIRSFMPASQRAAFDRAVKSWRGL